MKIEDFHIAVTIRTSKSEYLSNPERWDSYAEDNLRDKIAQQLVVKKSVKREYEDMVERVLDVYVASPDVFWKLIRQEAERIALSYGIDVKGIK
jgi:hypothetical protein